METLGGIKMSTNMNMSAREIQNLLKKDIAEQGRKPYHPKVLFRGGVLTKKADAYNRRLIREGKTTLYLNKDKLYNLQTGKFINKPIDRRSGKIKQSFLKKKEVFNGVVAPKKKTLDFSYTFGGGQTNWSLAETMTLNSNRLLQDIIAENGISGNYRLMIQVNGSTIRDMSVNVNQAFINSIPVDFQGGESGTMVWNEDLTVGDNVTFIFTKETLLPPNFYNQKYLDGVSHCVLTPIKEWATYCLEKAGSKSTEKKYNAILNKLKQDEITFEDGMSEEQMEAFCDKYQISIELSQPFGSAHKSFKSQKKSLKKFKFVNTRLNHVECGDFGLNQQSLFKTYDPEIVTKEELKQIADTCWKNNEICIYNKNLYGLSVVRTLTHYYKLSNDYKDAVKEFEKSTGLRYCAFDAKAYPELMKFVNAGTHFNCTVDWYDTRKYRCYIPDYVNHIDMKSAYTNYAKSKFYCGFMGKITDFRRVDNYDVNGLYYIEELSLLHANPLFKKYNSKLKWFVNNNVYTKAELDCLKHYGANFKVKYGAYGIKTDFEFTDEMKTGVEVFDFDDKEVKIKFYAKWCGMNCRADENQNFYMRGELDYLKNLDTDANLWYDGEEVRVAFQNNYSYTKKHITSQITAYQRLLVLEQLMLMPYDKIIRVCVDGIYFNKLGLSNNQVIKPFRYKNESMTFNNDPCENYLSQVIECGDINFECKAKQREHYLKEVFDAEGGNGKTFYNLNDTGFINVCYVPHSEKLASAMRKEFGVKTSNHTRCLSEPFSIQEGEILKHNVYVFDECSMITESQKKYIFDKCAGKIIMCGDLACQLQPVEGGMMTRKGFDNVDKVCVKNYRFKDEKIKALIKDVRDIIINNKVFRLDNLLINKIKQSEVKSKYDHKNDIILVSRGAKKNKTSNLNDYWCNEFPDLKKYKVEANSRDYKNGDIVFENVGSCELRHGFTVHSVQGETYNGNIFIDMRYLSDVRMFYTAISRAKYWNQIYILI
jgi:hypothetical protein